MGLNLIVQRNGSYLARIQSRFREATMQRFFHAIFYAFFVLAPCMVAEEARAQQPYPTKPIQLVVTTAAGGANDLIARTLANRLSELLQQPIVIENQPAANGNVAASHVARAPADGHTLMVVVDSTMTINPHLYDNISYNVFRDFKPVSLIVRAPVVMVVHPGVKANTVQELISLAKSAPGKLNYASSGVGTQLHMGMELFKMMTGTDIVHVPYRATTTAMADLLGGRVDIFLASIGSVKSSIDAGKLKVLAIGSERSPIMPDLPTIAESGVPGYNVSSWFGMFGPANLPPHVMEKLSSAIKQTAADPRFVAAMAPQGMRVVGGTPAELRAAMQSDSEKWSGVIKRAGIKIN
jgi:tripartite-type tricarboxylate transporter receptor subunit TctC